MANLVIPRNPSLDVSIFFGKMFHLRDVVHLTHLRQRSNNGWEHNALNTLYDEMLDQVDKIIEAYQGIYGTLDITIPSSRSVEDPILTIKEYYDYFNGYKEIYFKDSWMLSEIDVLLTTLAQTLYRLKYTK